MKENREKYLLLGRSEKNQKLNVLGYYELDDKEIYFWKDFKEVWEDIENGFELGCEKIGLWDEVVYELMRNVINIKNGENIENGKNQNDKISNEVGNKIDEINKIEIDEIDEINEEIFLKKYGYKIKFFNREEKNKFKVKEEIKNKMGKIGWMEVG